MDSRIKTPKVERVLLHQHHRSREYVTGTLCLTDRHFIFIEPTGLKETWVLYHHILSCDRQALTTRGYPLVIDTKTFQRLCLIIPRETDCINIIETIFTFSQPERHEDLYAYQYKPNFDGFSPSRGWNVYDPIVEYGRMGLDENLWKISNLNANYEMCPTYCSVLVLPNIDDSIITGSAKFRSKGRLPTLSYYCSTKKSALCRCSQPLSYITRRSVEDEAMIQGIVQANPNSSFIYLIDTRPKLNAVVNKAAHKGGYESTENYPNVKYQFKDIPNIHVMRESLQKINEAVHSSSSVNGFLSAVESSSWLKHIHLIIEASSFIAKALYIEGVSVLVHCSDGWDRTAQTCALASMLIDPFYRTIHGFMILIEREWLSFGHKFSIRCGHLQGDMKETSPIFTQFLDSTWQVMEQFPDQFQFNELFLIMLHDHLFSCQFGTFLGNNERERKLKGFSENTYSLWGHIWARLEDFINPLYSGNEDTTFISPNAEVPYLKFWRGMYCRHESGPHPHELWQEVGMSIRQQNRCLEDHIKFLQQHKKELEEKLLHGRDKKQCNEEQKHTAPTHQTSSQSQDKVAESNEDLNNMRREPEVMDQPGEATPTNIDSEDNRLNEQCLSNNDQPQSESICVPDIDDVTCPLPNPPAAEYQDNKKQEKIQEEGSTMKNSSSEFHKPKIQKIPSSEPVKSLPPSLRRNSSSTVELQSLLLHIPEMNLPWRKLREVSKCSCGVAFSFTERKYHCSYCGTVMCAFCGINHSQIPYMSLPSQHRVCKTCFKLMTSRLEDEVQQNGN